VDSVLNVYQAFDLHADRVGRSAVLRPAAEWLADHLPAGDSILLARTDAALMVCAGCAVLRDSATTIERASFGRIGWTPADGAILVEPMAPTPGLLATLKDGWPSLELLTFPSSWELSLRLAS
jgi:hypothetical protein